MTTRVQCPSCKGRPEWERSHDPDNRCVIMRCRECGRPMPETLYEHLDALEGRGNTTGFTEDEKLANTSLLQMDAAFRQLRPIDADSQETLNRAVTALRMTLAKRVMLRDLPREITQ